MKIAIDLHAGPVGGALEAILKATGHALAATVEEADVVIAEEPRSMLRHLKDGKRVVQFITDAHRQSPVGLGTTPEYADRFRVFQVVEWHKDVPTAVGLMAYLCELSQEVA
jgi:hypothetical protein